MDLHLFVNRKKGKFISGTADQVEERFVLLDIL